MSLPFIVCWPSPSLSLVSFFLPFFFFLFFSSHMLDSRGAEARGKLGVEPACNIVQVSLRRLEQRLQRRHRSLHPCRAKTDFENPNFAAKRKVSTSVLVLPPTNSPSSPPVAMAEPAQAATDALPAAQESQPLSTSVYVSAKEKLVNSHWMDHLTLFFAALFVFPFNFLASGTRGAAPVMEPLPPRRRQRARR
jgi:hypothetical protein